MTKTDLDDTVLLRGRVQRVLNVTFTNDAKVTNNVDGSGTEHVVVRIRERLRGSDDNRVSGVNTKRVKVL